MAHQKVRAKEAIMSEPQRNLTADAMEVVEGSLHEKLEGSVPEVATEAELREALEQAFDYRGDVTITRKDGSRVEGYIFDRRSGPTLADSVVRIIPDSTNPRLQEAADRSEFTAENFHSLFRHRRPGLLGARHCRRQKLGSLGPQILGEEGRRRKAHRPGAGRAGVVRVASKQVLDSRPPRALSRRSRVATRARDDNSNTSSAIGEHTSDDNSKFLLRAPVALATGQHYG